MRWLLDANVLIALSTVDHVDHARASSWFFLDANRPFATCPITQGALIRFQLRFGLNVKAKKAWDLLAEICALPNHEFWPDDIELAKIPIRGIVGHRQVTDAYLVGLAVKRNGQLATMDQGLVALHPGRCTLVPQ